MLEGVAMQIDHPREKHPAARRLCRPIDVDRFDPPVVDEDAASAENPVGGEDAVRDDFEGHDGLVAVWRGARIILRFYDLAVTAG
jgi:hypothetical protein